MRYHRSNPRKYAILGIVCGILLGVGTLFAPRWWVTGKVGDVAYQGLDEVPTREVAMVPGVGAKNGGMPQMLRERLAVALALYRGHKVEVILVSGVGAGPGEEIAVMRRWLERRGVPPEHILSDPAGYRTLDTMQRAARLLRIGGGIVCTQALFMNRSIFLAQQAGIDAVGLIAPQREILGHSRMRLEALKTGLALVDTYLLHRGPRVWDADGVVDSRNTDRTLAAAPSRTGPPEGP